LKEFGQDDSERLQGPLRAFDYVSGNPLRVEKSCETASVDEKQHRSGERSSKSSF